MPIDVSGLLTLDGPTGKRLALSAQGDVLRLEAAAFGDAATLMPASLLLLRHRLRKAATTLCRTGLRFELIVAGRPALLLGSGVRPTFLARVLGLPSARFSLRILPQLAR